MLRHMTARGLADPPSSVADRMAWQAYGLMIGFGLSIPVFFVMTNAWVLWFAGPVVAGQLRRRQRRGKPRTDPG